MFNEHSLNQLHVESQYEKPSSTKDYLAIISIVAGPPSVAASRSDDAVEGAARFLALDFGYYDIAGKGFVVAVHDVTGMTRSTGNMPGMS